MTYIISRHAATVEWLRECGYDGEVIAHVSDPSILKGQIVIGNLPLHLAAQAALVGAVEFDLPAEMRGQELTIEWLRENARIRWYTVRSESPERYFEALRAEAEAREAYAWRGMRQRPEPRQKADSLADIPGFTFGGDRSGPPVQWSSGGDGPDGPEDE